LEISVNSTIHGLFKQNSEEHLTVTFMAQLRLLMLRHASMWACFTCRKFFQWVSSLSYGI